VGAGDGGHLGGRIDAHVDRQTAAGGIEGREGVGAQADDGHAHCLQVFDRGRQVEDGFGPGADDDHRRAAELDQVGGNVKGVAAVHAADAAGGKHRNTHFLRGAQRAGHGGPAAFTTSDGDTVIAQADLAGVGLIRQALDFLARQAHAHFTIHQGDGGGQSADRAHFFFDGQREFHVLRARQAVGDHGRFKGDDRQVLSQRQTDLLAYGIVRGELFEGGLGFHCLNFR